MKTMNTWKTRWEADGADYNWSMPTATWWKRLPIIRHVRVAFLAVRVERHYKFYASLGLLDTGYDMWVLTGIWHGMEKSNTRS